MFVHFQTYFYLRGRSLLFCILSLFFGIFSIALSGQGAGVFYGTYRIKSVVSAQPDMLSSFNRTSVVLKREPCPIKTLTPLVIISLMEKP